MAAEENNDTVLDPGGDFDDSALDQIADIGAEDDLESQMASAMDNDTDSDDLEAQMAAAMNDDSDSDGGDIEAQMAAAMEMEVGGGDELDLEAQMAAAMGEDDLMGDGSLDLSGLDDGDAGLPVQPLEFQQLHASEDTYSGDGIERLMDVSLNVSVELGRKQMQIKDILGLGPGKIIELDKLAGEPVDLLVNGKLLAKGEVVVVDENFGVRITDLINPKDRIKML